MALLISNTVLKQMRGMPKDDRDRIMQALKQISADLTVRPSFVTELVNSDGAFRVRKGDWRAVYDIIDGDVVVRKVGHRKDVYK